MMEEGRVKRAEKPVTLKGTREARQTPQRDHSSQRKTHNENKGPGRSRGLVKGDWKCVRGSCAAGEALGDGGGPEQY